MSTDRDVTRIVRSWLEEGVTTLPDRVLDAVLDQLPATPQRRFLWPARRFQQMNNYVKFAAAAAAVALVAIVGVQLLPGDGRSGSVPNPSTSPSTPPSPGASPTAPPSASNVPTEFPGELQAGTYTVAPFAAVGTGICYPLPQPGCTETAADDTIRVTVTVPDGWSGIDTAIWLEENKPPSGAALGFGRGAWLLSDPCKPVDADIPVGTSVSDFVDAIAQHPVLDTTTPIDTTLGGYSGQSFDLLFPADLSTCPQYRPWEPGIYAQGPGHRWHLWVLDVDGVRVVVQSMDYAGTSDQRRTELQAMVDSIRIDP